MLLYGALYCWCDESCLNDGMLGFYCIIGEEFACYIIFIWGSKIRRNRQVWFSLSLSIKKQLNLSPWTYLIASNLSYLVHIYVGAWCSSNEEEYGGKYELISSLLWADMAPFFIFVRCFYARSPSQKKVGEEKKEIQVKAREFLDAKRFCAMICWR